MASLSEMLAAAQFVGKNRAEASAGGQLSSLLQSGLEGYSAGVKQGRETKLYKLNAATKLLELNKLQADLDKEAQRRTVEKNFLKQMGLLPLDESESDTARTVAFDGLGGGMPTPKDNTSMGKVARFYMDGVGYRVKPKKFGAEGLSWEFEDVKAKKEKGGASAATTMEKVRKASSEAARRDKYNLIASTLGPDEAAKYANVQPSEDEIQKYIPEFTAYFEGDTTKFNEIRKKRGNQTAESAEAIGNVKKLIDDTGFFSRKEKPGYEARRKALAGAPITTDVIDSIEQQVAMLQSGKTKGTPEALAKEIGVHLRRLSQNPQANREAIRRLVQQKYLLLQLEGK